MTSSPEAITATYKPVDELLRLRDPDPYGYTAQAAGTLSRLSLSNDHKEGFMAVADYASAVHDPELMESCLQELDLPSQWQILAHEIRDRNYAIDSPTISRLGESLAEFEAAPDSERDWLALSDIYESRAEVMLVTGGEGLDSQLDLLASTLQMERDANGKKPYSDLDSSRIHRRIVHALLTYRMPEAAARFVYGLRPYYSKEYTASLPLYERHWSGKSLAPVANKDSEKVFRRLAPEEYISSNSRTHLQPQYGATEGDLLALLEAGRIGQAQRFYERKLDYSHDFSGERVTMALWMARYVSRGENNPEEADSVSAMDGCRALARSVESDMSNDVQASLARMGELETTVQTMCERVNALPYSSQRIAFALELSCIQQQLLPQSSGTAEHCDVLLFDTWRVTALTLGGLFHDNYAPGLRDLWEQFKEVGFNLKKLQSMDRRFADYMQPKFKPESNRSAT